jgi:hypothetical protein
MSRRLPLDCAKGCEARFKGRRTDGFPDDGSPCTSALTIAPLPFATTALEAPCGSIVSLQAHLRDFMVRADFVHPNCERNCPAALSTLFPGSRSGRLDSVGMDLDSMPRETRARTFDSLPVHPRFGLVASAAAMAHKQGGFDAEDGRFSRTPDCRSDVRAGHGSNRESAAGRPTGRRPGAPAASGPRSGASPRRAGAPAARRRDGACFLEQSDRRRL